MPRHAAPRPWLAYAWLAAVALGILATAIAVARPSAPVSHRAAAPSYHASAPGIAAPWLPPPRPRPVLPRHAAVPRYTVRPGDTLWAIARDRCGSPLAWHALYAANREVIGPDPDVIRPGMRYALACRITMHERK